MCLSGSTFYPFGRHRREVSDVYRSNYSCIHPVQCYLPHWVHIFTIKFGYGDHTSVASDCRAVCAGLIVHPAGRYPTANFAVAEMRCYGCYNYVIASTTMCAFCGTYETCLEPFGRRMIIV